MICYFQYLCSFHKSCENPTKCIALVCYGKFLHTVIAGWDDKECIKTFETVGENTLMLRHLNNIVKCKAGTTTLRCQVGHIVLSQHQHVLSHCIISNSMFCHIMLSQHQHDFYIVSLCCHNTNMCCYIVLSQHPHVLSHCVIIATIMSLFFTFSAKLHTFESFQSQQYKTLCIKLSNL